MIKGMHLPHLFFEKQVCGKAGKRIISDLGVPSKHSNEKGQARGSGLMGFHILLREGLGPVSLEQCPSGPKAYSGPWGAIISRSQAAADQAGYQHQESRPGQP